MTNFASITVIIVYLQMPTSTVELVGMFAANVSVVPVLCTNWINALVPSSLVIGNVCSQLFFAVSFAAGEMGCSGDDGRARYMFK